MAPATGPSGRDASYAPSTPGSNPASVAAKTPLFFHTDLRGGTENWKQLYIYYFNPILYVYEPKLPDRRFQKAHKNDHCPR